MSAYVRVWRARTTPDREADYVATVRSQVLPHLREAPGYVGATFMARDHLGDREILVVTKWASADAAGGLGPSALAAYVPDAIRATLVEADATVDVFEVLIDDADDADDGSGRAKSD